MILQKPETDIEGPLLLRHQVHYDSRGFFQETYNRRKLEEFGIFDDFVQDNLSSSAKNVLRGLHYQVEPMAQAKIIRVLTGEILDVIVDIRPESSTFLKHYSLRMSADDGLSLYIPAGFAHGFITLSDHAHLSYKCSNYWSREHERGIIYNDPALGIDWGVNKSKLIISDRDRRLKPF